MQIILTGYRKGVNQIQLTNYIALHTGCGLSQAKQITDDVLFGKQVAVTFSDTANPLDTKIDLLEICVTSLIPNP